MLKNLENLLFESMKIIPTVKHDLLVGNEIRIGSPKGIKISETLVKAFNDINAKKGTLTMDDIETEVINQACLMYFALDKQMGFFFNKKENIYIDLSTIYSFIAEASVQFYEEEEMYRAQKEIPRNIQRKGMLEYLKDYYKTTHNIDIDSLLLKLI